MITGMVKSDEGRIRLKVKGLRGREQEVEAVIDTGYTASLTLPPDIVAALGLRWPSVNRDRIRLRGQGSQGSDHLYARGTRGSNAMNDLIVDEVRKVRDAHAVRFNYDLDAIFRDIKEQERNSGRKFVSFAPVKAEPNKTLQPTEAAIRVSQDSELSE
jgi:hypothetical protein